MRAILHYEVMPMQIICVPKTYKPLFKWVDKNGKPPDETADEEIQSLARQFDRYIRKGFNKRNDLLWADTFTGKETVWQNAEKPLF